MRPSCPWENLVFRPAEFCEESVCDWIRQPGNTWTNIDFLLVGLLIWRAAGRERLEHLRGLALIALATGVGSAFFHASETFIGRIFDYGGIVSGGVVHAGRERAPLASVGAAINTTSLLDQCSSSTRGHALQ